MNFISTLGFNPTSDQEIFSRDELIRLFDLSKVNRGGAIMNLEKLDWMNQQYLGQLSNEQLTAPAGPYLPHQAEATLVGRALIIERRRIHRLDELAEKIESYLSENTYDTSILVWKMASARDALLQLTQVRLVIAELPENIFAQVDLLEVAIKEYIQSHGLKNGQVLWPLRAALSGAEKSASPFEYLWVLGQETALDRLDTAISRLNAVKSEGLNLVS